MRAPRSSRLRAAAAVALVGALSVGCGGEPEPPPATSLIGLDGADWRNALPLMRQGKLPTLSALSRAGVHGTMLTNADYRWSPVLWTTIATGRRPEAHGVTSFMAEVPGLERLIPTPSTERRVRALWNMFTEKDRTVGFVGWWVTWPAEPVNGFMVSDHFSVSRFDLGRDYERDREREFSEKATFPEGLAASLAPHKVARQEIGRADLEPFADLPAGFRFPERFRKFDKVSEFAIAHSVDRTHFAAGERLLRDVEPELFGVFFQGIDIMQHYFWEFLEPQESYWEPAPEDVAAWGETIERYYTWTDARVADLVEAGGDRAVFLVSDHGFRPSDERYADKNISGEHRRQAFWLQAGPGIRRGVRLDDLDAVDVTPTVLAYHGLPVADDFDGDAVLDAFTDAWIAAHPPETIDTWEVGEWQPGELPEGAATRDLEERIRALGYIE